MINISVETVEMPGIKCWNSKCKYLSEYIGHIIGDSYFLKQGSTMAIITTDNGFEIYCRDCIDEVYRMIKSKLDTKLWAFQ
jgi:hypothetical protein